MPATMNTRRHDLDWLRVVAFMTLILYHVGMFYVTWDWHVKSDYASGAIEPAMRAVNPWRLMLLFFISGVALRFVMDARGAGPVARKRVGRLLTPLGFGMLVVVMPQAYFELRSKGEIGPGLPSFYPRYLSPFEQYSIITPTWNHLWYLPYILLYTLILAAASSKLRRVQAWAGPSVSRWLTRSPWLVLAPILPLAIYAVVLEPMFPTTHIMINDWANHAESLTAVLLGWFAAKSASFWSAVRRCLIPVVMGAVMVGVVWLLVQPYRDSVTGTGLLPAAVAALRASYAWVVIVSVLALAQRWLNRPGAVVGYATEAVIVWYILHQTLTVTIGYQFIGSGLPLWLEATTLIGGTMAGCALLHEFVIRRVRWLRPWFGLKPLPRLAAAPAPPGSGPA